METVALSIEEWCRLAESGTKLPVEITLAGNSMEPLIRMNRDAVVIVPSEGEVKTGDIVLFRRADGVYVVHRVYRVSEDQVVTLGDHCEKPDPPVKRSDILGKVIQIKRGKRIINTDSKRQQKLGQIGMKLLPVRKRVLHLQLVIRKNLGKTRHGIF